MTKNKKSEIKLQDDILRYLDTLHKAGGEWCRVESVEDVKNVLKRMDW